MMMMIIMMKIIVIILMLITTTTAAATAATTTTTTTTINIIYVAKYDTSGITTATEIYSVVECQPYVGGRCLFQCV